MSKITGWISSIFSLKRLFLFRNFLFIFSFFIYTDIVLLYFEHKGLANILISSWRKEIYNIPISYIIFYLLGLTMIYTFIPLLFIQICNFFGIDILVNKINNKKNDYSIFYNDTIDVDELKFYAIKNNNSIAMEFIEGRKNEIKNVNEFKKDSILFLVLSLTEIILYWFNYIKEGIIVQILYCSYFYHLFAVIFIIIILIIISNTFDYNDYNDNGFYVIVGRSMKKKYEELLGIEKKKDN
jgi:hypothetical protein